ncbi:MAG: hypothetical protein SFU27_02050 [Thermonemataceae bacterium]|nr:hypothetical protein [Thermonemataceae bacterium]
MIVGNGLVRNKDSHLHLAPSQNGTSLILSFFVHRVIFFQGRNQEINTELTMVLS